MAAAGPAGGAAAGRGLAVAQGFRAQPRRAAGIPAAGHGLQRDADDGDAAARSAGLDATAGETVDGALFPALSGAAGGAVAGPDLDGGDDGAGRRRAGPADPAGPPAVARGAALPASAPGYGRGLGPARLAPLVPPAELGCRLRHPPRRGDQRQPGKDPGQRREGRGPEAEGQEEGDGLAPFQQAARVIPGLAAARFGRQAPLGGEDGKAEESRGIDVETGDQRRARHGIRPGIEQDETQRHGGVEDEIRDDIEEPAQVRKPRSPGNRPVQPIRQPRGQDQPQRDQRRPPPGDGPCRTQAQQQPRQRHRIRPDPAPGQTPAQPVQRRVDQRAEVAVQHRALIARRGKRAARRHRRGAGSRLSSSPSRQSLTWASAASKATSTSARRPVQAMRVVPMPSKLMPGISE